MCTPFCFITMRILHVYYSKTGNIVKLQSFWGRAPDPDGGAYSAPPYPVAVAGGYPLPHHPSHTHQSLKLCVLSTVLLHDNFCQKSTGRLFCTRVRLDSLHTGETRLHAGETSTRLHTSETPETRTGISHALSNCVWAPVSTCNSAC